MATLARYESDATDGRAVDVVDEFSDLDAAIFAAARQSDLGKAHRCGRRLPSREGSRQRCKK
jgi:hypothetical protein